MICKHHCYDLIETYPKTCLLAGGRTRGVALLGVQADPGGNPLRCNIQEGGAPRARQHPGPGSHFLEKVTHPIHPPKVGKILRTGQVESCVQRFIPDIFTHIPSEVSPAPFVTGRRPHGAPVTAGACRLKDSKQNLDRNPSISGYFRGSMLL
jgi:hypothetical protein